MDNFNEENDSAVDNENDIKEEGGGLLELAKRVAENIKWKRYYISRRKIK